MEDSTPPSVFSKVAHQWVHKSKRDSVVFVMFTLKADCEDQARAYLGNTLHKTEAQTGAVINDKPDCCTGFIIGNHGRKAYIVTCCHSFKGFYTADHILKLEHVNWFDSKVICIHQERRLASSTSSPYDAGTEDPRVYTTATALKVDGKKDLILLAINVSDLHGSSGSRCQVSHVPLMLAKSVSPQLSDVVMISWPPYLPDMVVTGEVTNKSRSYTQPSKKSNEGYDMELIELNIIGRDGCSGSPILNHEAEVVGVYHGRTHGKGYAISFKDVNNFLGPNLRQSLQGST